MSVVQNKTEIMNKSSRITTFSSMVLACSGIVLTTGCGIGSRDDADTSQVALEIRFQDDTAPAPSQSSTLRRLFEAAPGPTTHDNVARILVDITFASSGQPFFTNFELTKVATDVWNGTVPFLPRDQQLRFAARALSAAGDVAFSGDTLATLTIDNQAVQIPLAPAQNGQTFQMPRLFRIAYPAQIQAGAEEQIDFTILDNAGASVGIQITPLGNPMTPSADFSPATGTVSLTNTVADFMTVYTAPVVTMDTDFTYQVTITDARTQSAVAITTNFSTHIIPRPPGTPIVHNLHPSVLFNPVILSLTANGSETPGAVELVANVSDDSTPDHLTVQWSFAPNAGTPDATFANGGLGNPGLFQGYTLAHQGTINLAVTDEKNGTTTLHYTLAPNQFADAIDHVSVNGLKRIVAGTAHTCVLTGQNQVRCWGDNQFGQLGYGNAIDVGDAPTRLPFTAGDVPLSAIDPMTHLPFDPVQQLVAGHNHTCALLESGLVTCWGDNRFGQLGYNRTDNLGDGEPVTSFGYVTLGDLATRIAAGGDHTSAILQSGALRCWGRNDFGQLGHGNTANIGDNETVFSAGNVDLGAGIIVKDLALGDSHTCALLTTGAVRCWGRASEGQLGYGNTNNLGDNEPINNLPNVSLTGVVRKLVAGAFHTCALTFAGTLRCWGRGSEGQLGQSFGGSDALWGNQANELPSTLPSDIIIGAQVTDVAAGDFHTCALSSDSQLKCWGRGDSGQLGYSNFATLSTPPAAGINLDGVTTYRIAAGAAHTCALRSGGTARCWGQGADGRLGRGSTVASASATGTIDIQIFAPPPTCGNGTLDPGEQCDDGNIANNDTCDDNCTAPRCGNGIVDPGEQCDDGNTITGDGCESNCTVSARSCAEILQRSPGAKDGVYSIAPLGVAVPFSTVCDMTRDGGGWTLLLKSIGDATLGYSASAWTDASLLNATDLTTQPGNAKYQSFLSLPITTLRGELDGFRYTQTFANLTAQQIFTGPAVFVNSFPTFNNGAPNWSTQPNCHTFGVNTPFNFARARFGWSANQENDCTSNDTAIGLGLMVQGVNLRGAGYECLSTLCSSGNVNIGGNGLLWGR